jgi:Putative Zn-dependent protease, contains TPR repeats
MTKHTLYAIIIYIAFFSFACSSSKQIANKQNKQYTTAKLQTDALFVDASTQQEIGNLDKAVEGFDKVIKQDPKYSSAYYQKASILFNKGQVQDGIDLNKKAISLCPKNEWYHLQLIQMYLATSNYKDAAKEYELLTKINPNDADYWQELAQVYMREGQSDKMLNTLDYIEDHFGTSEEITLFKLRYYISKNYITKAEEISDKLEAQNSPYQSTVFAILAELYMKNKNYDKAQNYYNKIAALDTNDAYINISLANLYLKKGDKQTAFSCLKKAINNESLDYSTKIQVILQIYAPTVDDSIGDFHEFFSLLKDMSLQYPEQKTVWELLSTGYMKMGQFDTASTTIKKALSLKDSSKDSQEDNYELYKNLLYSLSTIGQSDTIILYAKQATETYPEQPLPYLFLGINYLYKDNYISAQQALKTGVGLVVSDSSLFEDFYSNLGEATYRLGQKKDAFSYFDKCLQYNGKNYLVMNNYAYYLSLEKQDLEKAEQMSKTVFERFPNNPTYVDTYAWVLYKRGKYNEAFNAMQNIKDIQSTWDKTLKEHYEQILKKRNR